MVEAYLRQGVLDHRHLDARAVDALFGGAPSAKTAESDRQLLSRPDDPATDLELDMCSTVLSEDLESLLVDLRLLRG